MSTRQTPEADLQRKVVAYARRRGWMTYHTHDSRRSDPGFPDLVLVRGDRLIFVELKAAKGRVSADQSKWLLALGATGAEVWCWYPDAWDDGVVQDVLA